MHKAADDMCTLLMQCFSLQCASMGLGKCWLLSTKFVVQCFWGRMFTVGKLLANTSGDFLGHVLTTTGLLCEWLDIKLMMGN